MEDKRSEARAQPSTRRVAAGDRKRGDNPIRRLQTLGQSVWLDSLRQSLVTSGELIRLIDEDGLRGVTSNPSVFGKAFAGSTDYHDALDAIERRHDMEPLALYETLAIRDIRDAADLLRPVYDATGGADGYVSLDVSPYLAHDTAGTVADAHRLWSAVNRENLMIAIPGTVEGVPAVRQLTSDGVNVNVTLLFSVGRYHDVAQAFIEGLAQFVDRGGDARRVAGVASVFVSRIDTMVDGMLARRLAIVGDPRVAASMTQLLGAAAIATATLAYHRFLDISRTPAWRALAARGGHPQRLLWADTRTTNPQYRDIRYIENLIGRDTISAVLPTTLDAFRDHGRPGAALGQGIEDARATMDLLASIGISIDEVAEALVDDGVRRRSEAFDRLLTAVDDARRGALRSMLDRQRVTLPGDLSAKVSGVVAQWQASGNTRRLWARDATLWTGRDEGRWLDWLDLASGRAAQCGPLLAFARDVAAAGVSHVVLLGMGGSSLCPEVMRRTFGIVRGFPDLHVLDSTDPAQIAATTAAIDVPHTLFVVSSKSGTTLEPTLLLQYFLARVTDAVGAEKAGGHFIAITDPGSALQHLAERERFGQVFPGVPGVGGRYSALSNVGLVPAALMGVDIADALDRTELMVHSCAATVPASENPAVVLGAILATLAGAGRDKVTFVASPGIASLGAWLEQLLAESTGKQGKGLIPVDREPIGAPGVYGPDRIFIYLRLDAAPDPAQDAAVDAIGSAGQPVVRIAIADVEDIGQEFFRWEMATAVAGSILGINPFDQPDVEASKAATRDLTAAFERSGSFPTERPIVEDAGLALFSDARTVASLSPRLGGDRSIAGYLRAHLDQLGPGDYVAILAYLAMTEPHATALQAMRRAVRDRTRAATCLGFGPRFLHSTGQVYKGGPNTGVFLQITCDDAADIPVPGHACSFGVVKAAEARGDFSVLLARDRRALRVHLGSDVQAGLRALDAALMTALDGFGRGR